MPAVVLLLLLLISFPAAADEWSVGPAPGSNGSAPVASIRNADGHLLILRGEVVDNAYWLYAEFRLGGGGSLARVLPTYQVDDQHMPENEWQLDHVQWGRTWGGMDATTACWTLSAYPKKDWAAGKVLHGFFTGTEIAIVYRTADGASKTTRFTLQGAKAAVVSATGWTIGD
jgi:hypothetical protein